MTASAGTEMSVTEARAELERLDARLVEAQRDYQTAQAAVRRTWMTARDVAAPLANQHKSFGGQRVNILDPELRRATLDLLRTIEEQDLILAPLEPGRPAIGLKILDPRPHRALTEAQERTTAAQAARDAFASDCRTLLEEAAAREAVGRVKDALQGDDPDALRVALAGVGVGDTPVRNTLTTEDLP